MTKGVKMAKEKTIAQQIKAEIIAKTSLKYRGVSVKGDNCGYSEAINIEVKDERFPLSVVENIAKQYQSIDRCEASGEVLMGGNTFVNVSYPWDMELSEEYEAELLQIIQPAFDLVLDEDWSVMDKNNIRFKRACKELTPHLNTDDDLQFTEWDIRAILGKIDNSKMW